MRTPWILTAVLAVNVVASCKKGEASAPTATAESIESSTRIEAAAKEGISGCDHDFKASAVVKHTWPYPAEARNVRWDAGYKKMRLKLKPTNAAFVTATVTWEKDNVIEVQDSQIVILKPRRLVAKRDLFVTRKVWDQGMQVERKFLVARAGEEASFMFYNSRGFCMVDTDEGAGWMQCTLDDAFEGLSEEHPFACEQVWWIKVRKSKLDQGWMVFDSNLMARVPPPADAAK